MRVFAFDLKRLPFSVGNHNGGCNGIAGPIVHDFSFEAISGRYPVGQKKQQES